MRNKLSRPALMGPFNGSSSAAVTPSAALWKKRYLRLLFPITGLLLVIIFTRMVLVNTQNPKKRKTDAMTAKKAWILLCRLFDSLKV